MTDTQRTDEHHDTEQHHPTPAAYVRIAVYLAVVTLIEVGAYYFTGIPDGILIISLLVMMVVKFFLVVAWFMHLRFDSPIFRRFFITGIVLSLAIYTIVLTLFGVFNGA